MSSTVYPRNAPGKFVSHDAGRVKKQKEDQIAFRPWAVPSHQFLVPFFVIRRFDNLSRNFTVPGWEDEFQTSR
jgi:hypothetical protein